MKDIIQITIICIEKNIPMMKKILTQQIGITCISYEQEIVHGLLNSNWGNFKVKVQNADKAFSLGVIVGRAQTFNEVNTQ